MRRENDELRRRLASFGDQEHKIRSYVEEISVIKRENDDLNRRAVSYADQ